jgi:hypothetical protein
MNRSLQNTRWLAETGQYRSLETLATEATNAILSL